jgi:outer membrane protein OmpA-like peptidoglycan-associated protein/opacity protein-like surface antigen
MKFLLKKKKKLKILFLYLSPEYLTKTRYMKKLFTFLILTALTMGTISAADYTHWSVYINGGASQFDGDVSQKYNQINPGADIHWTAGAGVEYTFTPFWGLGVEYQYMPYSGYSTSTSQGWWSNYGEFDFEGSSHQAHLFTSLNLTNLLNVYRKQWRFNVYANIGLGASFYNASQSNIVPASIPPGGWTFARTPKAIEDGRSLLVPMSLNFEYNISKPLAVGLNIHYRATNKDNYEGEAYVRGVQNDNFLLGTASLRYKFASGQKDGHIRNITADKFRQEQTKEREILEKLDSLNNKVDDLDSIVKNDLTPRMNEVERLLSDQPDADGDGVPDWRDREPNTPPGSFVNYWGESLPYEVLKAAQFYEELAKMQEEEVDYDMSVYFAFDKKILTKRSIDNIAKAAQKLKSNPLLKVELRGYADFPGSYNYNLRLSTSRGEVVKQELVNKHGIDPSRITLNPQGRMTNPPNANQKNRRTDFVFSKMK